MKKLVSVALVLCMVLALIPAMAFAASSPKAMVGETPYNTIQDAIDAASAPGAPSNRVDIVDDVAECTAVIKSDIVIQLNGHTVSGKVGSYSDLPFNIVSPTATLTLQGPGTVKSTANGDQDKAVLVNTGKLVIGKGVQIYGVIVNTGDVTKNDANLNGYFDNKGTVTVNDGIINVPSGHSAFENTGKVTVNCGRVYGTLDTRESCAGMTVNGGAFNDVHAVKHTGAPVAGVRDGTIPGIPFDVLFNPYIEYWVGTQAMVIYANAYNAQGYNGEVDFLVGDAKVDGMPTLRDGWKYKDMWDGYYNDAEQKYVRNYLDVDKDGTKEYPLTGRGLVNSRSDLNITASKHNVATSNNVIADSVMSKNAQYVQSVEAICTGVNKNEVFYNIVITADLDKLTDFKVPEGFSGWGNKNGSHKWVPITLEFTNLNGEKVDAASSISCRDAWNTAFAYQTTADGHFHLWIGVDHVLLGSNSSWDFADLRYGDHGLIYRCTIVVQDKDGNVPKNSEPDDTTGAAAIPSGSGNAGSKPAGTGNGEGPAKTGDNSTVMLWATLLVASAAGVAICVVDEAKKRSRK